MQTVSIIRDRGQLTIPESIRRVIPWVTPMSAVSISVVRADEIRITPHQKTVDWDKLWALIKEVRAYKGKGGGNLSKFVSEDRESRA